MVHPSCQMVAPMATAVIPHTTCSKGSLVHLRMDQFKEVCAKLDNSFIMNETADLSDVQTGWKLKFINQRPVLCQTDLLNPNLKNGRVTLLFHDYSCKTVSNTPNSIHAATLLWNVVKHQKPVSLCHKLETSFHAAADAFAASSKAGIGGWFVKSDAPLRPRSIHWFPMELTSGSLPQWFTAQHADLSKAIAALEALAQFCLFMLTQSHMDPSNHWTVHLSAWCDNHTVVLASQKDMSQSQPLAQVLQVVGYWACKLGCHMSLSHKAGCRNEWADHLSRDKHDDAASQFWSLLDTSKRCTLNLDSWLAEPFASISCAD